jgi:hypothetical protein
VAIIKRKGYNSEAKEAVSIDPQHGKLNCTWMLGFSLHRCFVKSCFSDPREKETLGVHNFQNTRGGDRTHRTGIQRARN